MTEMKSEDIQAALSAAHEQAEQLEAANVELAVWRKQFAGMTERVQIETAWRIVFGEDRSLSTFLETLQAIRSRQ